MPIEDGDERSNSSSSNMKDNKFSRRPSDHKASEMDSSNANQNLSNDNRRRGNLANVVNNLRQKNGANEDDSQLTDKTASRQHDSNKSEYSSKYGEITEQSRRLSSPDDSNDWIYKKEQKLTEMIDQLKGLREKLMVSKDEQTKEAATNVLKQQEHLELARQQQEQIKQQSDDQNDGCCKRPSYGKLHRAFAGEIDVFIGFPATY